MIALLNRPFCKMSLALAAMFCLALQPVRAADFYAGKTIELIVANTVGGGYDQYGRIIARHFGRLIPGQPTLIVRNMPGAGGVRAANYMATIPPRDGTVLALLTREVALAPLLAWGASVEGLLGTGECIGDVAQRLVACVDVGSSLRPHPHPSIQRTPL